MTAAKSRLAAVPTLLLGLLIILTSQGCKAQNSDPDVLSIQYFYMNVCASCDPEGDFLDHFEQYTGISRQTPNLSIETYNVYHSQGSNVFDRRMDALGVAESQRTLPMLLIGDTIVHAGQIDEALADVDFAARLPDMAATVPVNASVAIYFSMPGCRDCEKAEQDILSKLPKTVKIKGIDSPVHVIKILASDEEGLALFREYCSSYLVAEDRQRTPLVFVGCEELQGLDEIALLSQKIEAGDGLETALLRADAGTQKDPLARYGWAGVLLTGLLNGFNPCAISMTLMLLSLLAAKRDWLLPAGLAFALGKFVGFLLLGTLLYSVLDTMRLAEVQLAFKIIMAVFAAMLIVLNLNDYFAEVNENYRRVRLQLPVGLRRWNHALIKKTAALSSPAVLIPGGALLGLIVAGGEFLCTGQIYVAVILMAVQSSSGLTAQALGYLVLYSLAFVLPLVALVILVSKGRQLFSLSELFRKHTPLVKLISALVFTAVLVFAILY